MLPKKFRTTVPGFAANLTPSILYTSPLFTLLVKKTNINLPRLVIVVPKRLDKRSTKRHLSKRLIIETLRGDLSKLRGGVDILIKAKKIITRENKTVWENEFKQLFKKAGLKKD